MPHIARAASAVLLALAPTAARAQSTFVVQGVRLFDGTRVAEHRSGRTLLPGLIDAHVHLSDSAEADLRQSLALGVTTDLDMFAEQ